MSKVRNCEFELWCGPGSLLFCGSFSILEFYSLYQLGWDEMCCYNSVSGLNNKDLFLTHAMCPLWVGWTLCWSSSLRDEWWSCQRLRCCSLPCLRGKRALRGQALMGLNTPVQKRHEALQLKNSLTRSHGAWFHPTTRGTESIVMNRTKDVHLWFVSLFLAQIDLLE